MKHLLKDYAAIMGYIRGTLGQQAKAQKPAPKAGDPVDAAPEDDAEFLEADRCLMIFGGSQAYESHRQQEVNAVHTLTALTRLRWS